MKRMALLLGLTLAVGIVVGVIGDQVLSAQQEPVKRTVLLKTDIVGMEGKEGFVMLAEIAPGATTRKHFHHAHEFAYVLEGSGTLEIEGKPSVSMKPGATLYQPPKQVHNGKNLSKTAPLKILVFYLAEKGQPLTAPVK